MQPARGRFARSDLDRQMASTIPAHWKVGPAPVFWASRPLEPAEWLALLILKAGDVEMRLGVITVFTLNSGCAVTSSDMRPTTPGFVPYTYQPPTPSPTQPTIAMTHYTHASNVINSSIFHALVSVIFRHQWQLSNNNHTPTFDIMEEFVKLIPMMDTITAANIFKSIINWVTKMNMDLSKLSGVIANGALAMVGDKNWSVALLQNHIGVDKS